MKPLLFTFATLLIVASLAAPASAFDARRFWDAHPSSGER